MAEGRVAAPRAPFFPPVFHSFDGADSTGTEALVDQSLTLQKYLPRESSLPGVILTLKSGGYASCPVLRMVKSRAAGARADTSNFGLIFGAEIRVLGLILV